MQQKRIHHIKRLINQGEHLNLDFKFEISDAAKIARSLVAFSNTKGGTLLIGVKDNGTLAGIRSEEEFYMAERASQNFCQPPVKFTSKEWTLDGKIILEIKVPVSDILPHRAPDSQGQYKVFVRVKDENILAHGIQIKVWKKQQADQAVSITYNELIKELLSLVENAPGLSVEEIGSKLNLSKHQLEDLLSDLIVMRIISMEVQGQDLVFRIFEE